MTFILTWRKKTFKQILNTVASINILYAYNIFQRGVFVLCYDALILQTSYCRLRASKLKSVKLCIFIIFQIAMLVYYICWELNTIWYLYSIRYYSLILQQIVFFRLFLSVLHIGTNIRLNNTHDVLSNGFFAEQFAK